MKIDLTKIEGYDNMSAEEKLKALEEFDVDTSGLIDKKLFDKTASELAALKKQNKEKLSEEEKMKAEQEELFKAMQEELNSLKVEKQESELTSKYLSLGYDEKLARDTAKAQISGDLDTVFDNQKKFKEDVESKLKAELLKKQPEPGGNGGEVNVTKEELSKMSMRERINFYTEHPDEYKAIYGDK